MKKPLNLKDLPGYLNALRGKQTQDIDLVVDMGTIKDESFSNYSNYLKILYPIGFLFLFLAGSSFIYYNLTSYKNVTIVLDTNNVDPKEFSNMMSESGVNIVSVKQNGNSSYEVELKLKKSLNSFLEKLRKNKNIKNIELKN